MNDEATHAARHAKIRERFLSGDAASHTDEGLLELLLTFGMPIKNAKAKHGAGKRVRVLFRLDEEAKT